MSILIDAALRPEGAPVAGRAYPAPEALWRTMRILVCTIASSTKGLILRQRDMPCPFGPYALPRSR